jgi:SAM-dependent methyltransferase
MSTTSTALLPESAQTHARYNVWRGVIPLPPASLMAVVGAGTVENFLVVADAWAQLATQYTRPGSTILDIGCGCGRTARILFNNPWIARYIGFDVMRENTEWCNRFIAPHWDAKAEFHWIDAHSAQYNPTGTLAAKDLRFPCEDGTADVILAASLFTHLLEADAIHYLRETARTLSARGTALFSIHNEVEPGQVYQGHESRIDILPDYFAGLAASAGLRERDRIDEVCGQQVFVFKRS